jgi:hypothetical protein
MVFIPLASFGPERLSSRLKNEPPECWDIDFSPVKLIVPPDAMQNTGDWSFVGSGPRVENPSENKTMYDPVRVESRLRSVAPS